MNNPVHPINHEKLAALVSSESLASYDISYLFNPEFGKWRLAEDACRFLGRICEVLKPRVVVEYGSGLSTLILLEEVRKGNVGEIRSVDHLETFPGHPSEAINDTEQSDAPVQFFFRPIRPRWLAGKLFQFYKKSDDGWLGSLPVDLVIIDGPPYYFDSREAALYEIFDNHSPNALVILDDANRQNREQVYLANWKRYYEGAIKSDIFLEQFEKGLACVWKTGAVVPVKPFPVSERMFSSFRAIYHGGLGIRRWLKAIACRLLFWR